MDEGYLLGADKGMTQNWKEWLLGTWKKLKVKNQELKVKSELKSRKAEEAFFIFKFTFDILPLLQAFTF